MHHNEVSFYQIFYNKVKGEVQATNGLHIEDAGFLVLQFNSEAKPFLKEMFLAYEKAGNTLALEQIQLLIAGSQYSGLVASYIVAKQKLDDAMVLVNSKLINTPYPTALENNVNIISRLGQLNFPLTWDKTIEQANLDVDTHTDDIYEYDYDATDEIWTFFPKLKT